MEISQERMRELAELMTGWAGGKVVEHPVYGIVVQVDGKIVNPLSCEILEDEAQ